MAHVDFAYAADSWLVLAATILVKVAYGTKFRRGIAHKSSPERRSS